MRVVTLPGYPVRNPIATVPPLTPDGSVAHPDQAVRSPSADEIGGKHDREAPMIQPSDPQPAWPRGQAMGAGGPVTCFTCGCRLTSTATSATEWTHFAPLGGRDARGCRVDCVDLPHDRAGRAILGVPA
ncbi:MAG: hypothetical protein QOF11_910 [Chloroflexota bacterium]|nr:hypothetical protein [Chloroflexota bacterium]